jgi:hypothetical protein
MIGACQFRLPGEQRTQPPRGQGRLSQLFENRDTSAGTQETTPRRWMKAEQLSACIQVTSLVVEPSEQLKHMVQVTTPRPSQ